MIWGVVIVSILIVSILTFGVFNISSGIYIKSLCRVRGDKRDVVAITFDDGVDPQITPMVLKVLDKYDAKATFFIIGAKAEMYPELVREIAQRGHSIGNHTMYHNWNFPMQRSESIYAEIAKCSEILEGIVGGKVKLFRPPFGVTNPLVANAIKRSGLTSIGWSIRSLDTLGQPLDKVEGRVVRQLSSGKVILLHDNRERADILLDNIMQHIVSMGLRCVTVDELFNLK